MKKNEPFVALKAFIIVAFSIMLSEWIEGPMSVTVAIIGAAAGLWVFLHGMTKD